MTRARILAGGAIVFSILPIAVGAAFRGVHAIAPEPAAAAPQASAELDFDERWISIAKGDRLPLRAAAPVAVASAQPDVAPPAASPTEQLPLATEDDLKQAEAEHHRHADICRRGRSYFTIQHHQYWRCN